MKVRYYMRAHLADVNLFFGGAPSFPITDFGMARTNHNQKVGHVTATSRANAAKLTYSSREDRKSIGAPPKNALDTAPLRIGAGVYSLVND